MGSFASVEDLPLQPAPGPGPFPDPLVMSRRLFRYPEFVLISNELLPGHAALSGFQLVVAEAWPWISSFQSGCHPVGFQSPK